MTSKRFGGLDGMSASGYQDVMTSAEFRAMRLAAGIRQMDMAAHLGMQPEHLCRIEAGRSPVKRLHVLAARQVIQDLK